MRRVIVRSNAASRVSAGFLGAPRFDCIGRWGAVLWLKGVAGLGLEIVNVLDVINIATMVTECIY